MLKKLLTATLAAALTITTYAVAVELTDSQPTSYTVKRGDTLWGIAARFLKKPWLWPEIWKANPELKNPHQLRPGDVLNLTFSQQNQFPEISVTPGTQEEPAIDVVPLKDIEAFLRDYQVVSQFDQLPHVVNLEDNRLIAAGGQKIYVTNMPSATVGQKFSVSRPSVRFSMPRGLEEMDFRGSVIKNTGNLWRTYVPANKRNELLGYEIQHMAGATVSKVIPGKLVELVLDEKGEGVRIGDRLTEYNPQPYDLQFFPHPPQTMPTPGHIRVIAVADSIIAAGKNNVIAISGGSREGINNGTVFSIWQPGMHVIDNVKRIRNSEIPESLAPSRTRLQVPDEYVAHAMVFRTFDNVSYALVMQSIKELQIGFELKHPDAEE